MPVPWDELRLSQVEAGAKGCPDACSADVESLCREVRRLNEQLRISTEALEAISATHPSGERYPGACGAAADDALNQISIDEPLARCSYQFGGAAGQCLYNAEPGKRRCRRH
jgi:hypothetical protein